MQQYPSGPARLFGFAGMTLWKKNNLLRNPPAKIHPDLELLLCCARARIDSETADRLRLVIRPELDWAYLVRTALRQKVLPLLYQSLKSVCPEDVPRATFDHLRDYYHSNARRNLFLTGELL